MEGDLIYGKTDELKRLHAEALRMRENALKKCVPFSLSCSAIDGKWGIWLQADDKRLLVDIIELVNTIFRNGIYRIFEPLGSDEPGYYEVDVERETFCYRWTLTHSIHNFSSERRFVLEEYQSKIFEAVSLMHRAITTESEVAYDLNDKEKAAITSCLKQLSVKSTCPHYITKAAKDIQVEDLLLDVVRGDKRDDYKVGFSNRSYATCFTDWYGDLERIRHQLESYIFEHETEIKVPFDFSETTIRLEDVSLLDRKTEGEEGIALKYEDYLLVTITPNVFERQPILTGYCEIEQSLTTLYTGFLQIAIRHPESPEYRTPDRVNAYNMVKSPLIEDRITGWYKSRDYMKCFTRQVMVKHIITIDPDVGQLFYDENGMAYEADREGVLELVYDREGKPIRMEDFVAWNHEIDPIVGAFMREQPYSMDWEEYHRRGIRLAEELRKVLSPDFDLWYTAPYEDTSGTIKRPILVLEPYTSRWPQDTSPDDDTRVVDEV